MTSEHTDKEQQVEQLKQQIEKLKRDVNALCIGLFFSNLNRGRMVVSRRDNIQGGNKESCE